MTMACGPTTPILEMTGAETATSEMPSDSSEGTTTMPQPPDPDEDSDESTTEFQTNFIEPHDVPMAYECDLWTQDCAAGDKCTVWANDGGSAWNATRCVPIVDAPDGPGEPCTVEGSGVSGLDTCALGSLCWDVDPETLEGVCREFCQGDESNPICSDPDTICGGPRNFPLCLPLCCPVEQDCSEGLGCYALSDTFTCAPDASDGAGEYADPCEYINVCKPGHVCLNTSVSPDCDETGLGCCMPFCTVGYEGSMACRQYNPALECQPWYDEDYAPPGYEFTGVCAIPWE